MPVAVLWPDTPVDEILAELGTESPQDRMVEHLKDQGLRIGLVTDGERWTLVSHQEERTLGSPPGGRRSGGREDHSPGLRTLLHQDRFLTLGDNETVSGLLDRSAEDQREITTKLGHQTLEAVEILIRTIDRIDRERGGELLREVEEEKSIAELYDAAVTVMMRLIFLFYAEENDLLPMSEPLVEALRSVVAARTAAGDGRRARRGGTRNDPRWLAPAAVDLAMRLRRSRAWRHGARPLRRKPVRPRSIPVSRRISARLLMG